MLQQGKDDPRPLLGQAALLAIPMAAVFDVFGVAGGVYLAPIAVVELVLVLRRYGWRRSIPAAGVFVVTFAVLSVSSLAAAAHPDRVGDRVALDDAGHREPLRAARPQAGVRHLVHR